MRWNHAAGAAVLCLLLAGLPVRADDLILPPFPPSLPLFAQAQPAQPAQPAPEPEPPPDLFAQAAPQGPSSSGGGHPHMLGDLNGGIFVRRLLTFPTTVHLRVTSVTVVGESTVTSTQDITLPSTITRAVNVPFASRGPFKIAENESPFPTTRVFSTYNYFNNVAVLHSDNQSVPPLVDQISSPSFDPRAFGPDAVSVQVTGFDPAPALRRLDTHREVVGFEQLLFGNNFSVGVRLPLIQQRGEPSLESSRLGDVSVVLKYALINNANTGNVLSAGFVVTAPTGEDAIATDGTKIHPTLLQPYMGYFANFGRFYVHGFSSAIFPTDSRDATLLCNDAGVGYRLYQDETGSGFVRYITPTLEGHATTPLDNRDPRGVLGGFPDIFVATGGLHIGLGGRASLTVGAGTPLAGPQPFDVEGVVQFNLRF